MQMIQKQAERAAPAESVQQQEEEIEKVESKGKDEVEVSLRKMSLSVAKCVFMRDM